MREREKSYFPDQGSYPQQQQEDKEVQLQSIVDRFSILKSVKMLPTHFKRLWVTGIV